MADESEETGQIASLRARAKGGGRTKWVLGVVVAVFGVGGNVALMAYLDGPSMAAAAGALLFLVWGIYLIYRGQRQVRVANGQVLAAVVLEARGQGLGKPGEQPVSYTLQVDVQLPGSGAAGGVIANTTNVFGADKAKGLVGRRIKVIWSAAFPADAYAAVDGIQLPDEPAG